MSLGTFIALYAGGLATFASPCVLPMLPLYLGVLAGAQASASAQTSKTRLRLAGVGFALGVGLVFVAMGMGATSLTQSLSGHRQVFEVSAGLLMMLFGAKLLGLLHLPWFDREARPLLHRVPNVGGFSGGLLFGAGFAVGWTPCVGPVLATALTYAANSTSSPLVAGGMLAVYALGLTTPLVLASFAASRLLAFAERLRKYTPTMQRVTGAALLALGALLATGRLANLSPNLSPTLATSSDCTAKAACETQLAATQAEVTVDDLPRGPALVEFVSDHCSICKKMHPTVSDLEEHCARGLIVRVNVDVPSGRQLASHYGVSVVPTFLSIDPSGGPVQRFIGEQSKERLILAINDLGAGSCAQKM